MTSALFTPIALRIRRETGVPTGAVGMISEPAQAEKVVATGQADVVLLARALLRDPHRSLRAAHELGVRRRHLARAVRPGRPVP
ncbi:MAG: hypothetical protein QOE59_161 [Actinomycetota bacterium]|nr:hypothetical protein [Actinomycetota bacterium]